MNEPTTYVIVIKGRANARLLRPLLDDFSINPSGGCPADGYGDRFVDGVTRLVGEVRDAAHLHGVVAHLTSVNVELISIAPLASIAPPLAACITAPENTDLQPTTNNNNGTSNNS